MIEINLVPDVKQELLRAQRVRTMVISFSILASIIAAGVVVLLAVYVFGAQSLRGVLADQSIKDEESKLEKVQDLSNALTIQNQLAKLSTYHNATMMDSRMFDVLTTIVPTGNNAVSVTDFSIDSDAQTITIKAESANGYSALEAFKKTIEATKFQYTTSDDSSLQTVPLTDQVSDGDRSYSQDASGKRTLSFSISFQYPVELFDRASLNGRVIAPSKTNATDSALAVPQSLFDAGGSN